MSGGDRTLERAAARDKVPAVTSAPAKRCGSCRSFRRNAQVIGQGVCGWGPPQCVPVMAGNTPSIMAARPPVSANDLCDQWSAKDGD